MPNAILGRRGPPFPSKATVVTPIEAVAAEIGAIVTPTEAVVTLSEAKGLSSRLRWFAILSIIRSGPDEILHLEFNTLLVVNRRIIESVDQVEWEGDNMVRTRS